MLDDAQLPCSALDVTYVLQVLEGSLPPKELERHTFGEVFTPLERVDEMLAALPRRLWSDPTKTWLDPAAGIGNFPIKIILGQQTGPNAYPGLWRGLAAKIPDPAKRAKHIVEQMVFLVDINPRNNRTARLLMRRLFPGFTPNISQIDPTAGFLTAKPHLQFPHGIQDQFNVIVGNPPFQIGAVRAPLVTNATRKRKANLGVSDDAAEAVYWAKFVRAALSGGRLAAGGYLAFIHPITWFKPDRAGAHTLLLSHPIHALKIFKNNAHTAAAAFGDHGKISVAWYVLENVPITNTSHPKTRIHYAAAPEEDEDVQLTPDSILVLRHNGIYQKILRSGVPLFNQAPPENQTLYHTTLRSCQTTTNPAAYRLISDIHQDGSMEYVLSKTPHPHQAASKVIVGGLHTPVIFSDTKDGRGQYGIYAKGQRNYFVGTQADLRAITAFFRTRLATLLLNAVKFEQDFIRPGFFPDVRVLATKGVPITDEGMADVFGFTKAQRAQVQTYPTPIHLKERDLVPRRAGCPKTRKVKPQS